MYDDKTVKVSWIYEQMAIILFVILAVLKKFFNDQVIGGWADVLTMCERGHLQPQVLFFEAVN